MAEKEVRKPSKLVLTRLQTVLLILAIAPVIAAAGARIANGIAGNAPIAVPGDDFSVFYTAGDLITQRSPDQLYDVAQFQAAFREATDREDVPVGAMFGNPPAFAVAMAPLATLPFDLAWVVWTGLGIAALGFALHRLGAKRVIPLSLILMASAPGWYVLDSGQSTFFWLAAIAGIFAAFDHGRTTLGGAIAGLLVLKPPLLIGFVLWWLIDRRMRPALVSATVTATVIVLASIPFTQLSWLDYPKAVFGFAADHRYASGQLGQYSPWGFLDLLAPGRPLMESLVGLAASILGVVAFWRYYLRHQGDWRLLFAGAIFATTWISPHTLAYDWIVLAAAFAALWKARPELSQHWLTTAAILSVVCFWSVQITILTVESFGWGLQFAVLAFALAAWWITRALSATPATAAPQ